MIEGPRLPYPDESFDAIVSVLAWRYIDWDPMVAEIHRVLHPSGVVIIIDMAVSPFRLAELPAVIRGRLRHHAQTWRHPQFGKSLSRLVSDQNWREMLRHNPMRAEHEYRNYLPSRFPNATITVLNRSLRSEMLGMVYTAKTLAPREKVGSVGALGAPTLLAASGNSE